MSTTEQLVQDVGQTGAEVKQRVVGGGAPSAGDPFLAPFFEAATEHVWGGLWNRPGLELKYRSLVVVSVLAATGHPGELKAHLHGALNLGWTAEELREADGTPKPIRPGAPGGDCTAPFASSQPLELVTLNLFQPDG